MEVLLCLLLFGGVRGWQILFNRGNDRRIGELMRAMPKARGGQPPPSSAAADDPWPPPWAAGRAEAPAPRPSGQANCRLLCGPHLMRGSLALPYTAAGGCWAPGWVFPISAMVCRIENRPSPPQAIAHSSQISRAGHAHRASARPCGGCRRAVSRWQPSADCDRQ
jgi:hypothetical protein